METLDQESTDDDSEEASHYPYGLCYKARDEDECLFNQKSNFSNFEAECNYTQDLHDLFVDKPIINSTANEDMIHEKCEEEAATKIMIPIRLQNQQTLVNERLSPFKVNDNTDSEFEEYVKEIETYGKYRDTDSLDQGQI